MDPVLNTSSINGMRELIRGISGSPLNSKLTPFLGLAGISVRGGGAGGAAAPLIGKK